MARISNFSKEFTGKDGSSPKNNLIIELLEKHGAAGKTASSTFPAELESAVVADLKALGFVRSGNSEAEPAPDTKAHVEKEEKAVPDEKKEAPVKKEPVKEAAPVKKEEMLLKTASTLKEILSSEGIPYQLVFVDDGSKDGSPEILDEYRHPDRRNREVRHSLER